MPEMVIVAIPKEGDPVWRFSSEKVPHLTLLSLGEMAISPQIGRIATYLEHAAATSLSRFGMEVERRGTLGPKDADVLFFGKHNRQRLMEFRAYLLTQPDIRRGYDSSFQFPEWVPHLTMGFPESPAHPDTREWPGISWVNFDRVALWTGDSDGPTFDLTESNSLEMGMDVDDTLAHFGVRGMKWGTRKAARTAQRHKESSVDRRAAVKTFSKSGGTKKVHSLTNKEMETAIRRVQLERQYKQVVPVSPGRRIVNAGGKIAGDILIGVGKTQATRVGNEQASIAVGKVLNK